MRHIAILLLTAVIIAVSAQDADAARRRSRQKQRGIETVKKEQRDTRNAIRQTAEQIESNKRNTARSLSRLESLDADMAVNARSIERISAQVDSIDSRIRALTDSVDALEKKLGQMRESYGRMVRRIHEHQRGTTSALAFIFSAETVSQGYRRMRYLKEVSAWRERRSQEIAGRADTLRRQKEHLSAMHAEKAASLSQLAAARRDLKASQEQTARIVDQLKKESTSLRQVLKEKEAKARALDAELDRLIAEEQRRQEEEQRREEERRRKLALEKQKKESSSPAPKGDKKGKDAGKATPSAPSKTPDRQQRTYATADETRALTGSFESNKGRLLFPVSGRYRVVRPFGRRQHPELPHVVTENAGIDIEVSAGATARAVFAGKVSAIFRQPGYNTIVMVRHGRYLTIYAGLTDITVRNGQELKQGQTIGKVFADPDDEGRAVLHFELRREKEKLNPSLWVK
ncbi:peptidoglycan DD-metalloendopeptidase family protein [uncultured Muribaculum sp.]|uniref:murein hydrolase activator EnvC family protein n=1 Tax=uncultured Muribaculum sp. TaxID=1918613 RepID=UPI0025E784F5|nr:peptidoglycan DD-metalloendopeptidase family protein [uncultured Muribaculum sp.]